MAVGSLQSADLTSIFEGCGDRGLLVGVEIECGLVHPSTGRCVSPKGESGGTALLRTIADRLDLDLPADDPYPLSIRLADGGLLSLELGGALEYSSPPYARLTEAVANVRSTLASVARIADSLGLALLTGGLVPFTAMSDIPWIDKRRVRIMRDHFSSLNESGSLACGVMGLALSTQTTLDYRSPADLAAKLPVLVAASPILAALFVNSPIAEGLPTGVLSRRMQYWRRVDPQRCGFQDWALNARSPVREMVERMLELPMLYRKEHDVRSGELLGQPGRTGKFRDLIKHGFDDGRTPALEDWRLHLSQVWPQVRVREFIETRAFDGPPWVALAAAPAIWSGLVYDEQSLSKAAALLAPLTASDLDVAVDDVAARGMNALVGAHRVRDLAGELLRFARGGLESRVSAGLDDAEVIDYLTPVEEVLDSGVTFAEVSLDRWSGEFDKRPDRYVEAYRVPVR